MSVLSDFDSFLPRNEIGLYVLTALSDLDDSEEHYSAAQLATRLGVSKPTVDRARALRRHGPDDLIRQVVLGKCSLATAYEESLARKRRALREAHAVLHPPKPLPESLLRTLDVWRETVAETEPAWLASLAANGPVDRHLAAMEGMYAFCVYLLDQGYDEAVIAKRLRITLWQLRRWVSRQAEWATSIPTP